MPRGSWLGLPVFLIMIDDLKPGMRTYKFMDDTAITEVIKKRQASQTESAVDELISCIVLVVCMFQSSF